MTFLRLIKTFPCDSLFGIDFSRLQTAPLVAEEFFQRGDLEQQELKAMPMAMMDRGKKDELPQMQVGFIDTVCLPLYKVGWQLVSFHLLFCPVYAMSVITF